MTYFWAIIAGIAGIAVGWLIAATLAVIIGGWLGVSNFEGALGMLAVFAVGPIGGLAGLVAGIWFALRRRGHRGVRGIAWRMPVVIVAIGGLVAGGVWVAYQMRPMLGTSSSGPPRLDFEIRLPRGTVVPSPASQVAIELNTERNQQPGNVFDSGVRLEDGRPVIAGSVELYDRSSWRLLELTMTPGGPSQLFELKLGARPSHMKSFGPWERVTFLAEPDQQPRPAGASDAYEIRTRVVYRDQELLEESAR